MQQIHVTHQSNQDYTASIGRCRSPAALEQPQVLSHRLVAQQLAGLVALGRQAVASNSGRIVAVLVGDLLIWDKH